jgi:tetratricopeptide (TPR) repeat protein
LKAVCASRGAGKTLPNGAPAMAEPSTMDTVTGSGEDAGDRIRPAEHRTLLKTVRLWFGTFLGNFWSASPDRQISQLYYVCGTIALLGGGIIWLWTYSAQLPRLTFTIASQAMARDNSLEDARRGFDRLQRLAVELRDLRPKSSKEINRALSDLDKGDRSTIERLLGEWAKEAANLNNHRETARAKRNLATVQFIYNKGWALDELESAVRIDSEYWDAWYDLGDVADAFGNTQRAQEAFRTALELAKFDSAQSLRQIKSLIRFSDMLRVRGVTAAGLISLDQAGTLIENELRRAPDDEAVLAARAEVSARKGEYFWEIGRETEGLKAFEESLAVALKLAERKSGDSLRQSDLVAAYVRAGNAFRKLGDIRAAEEAYGKAEVVARGNAITRNKNPLVAEPQEDLATSYTHLGKLRYETGDHSGALKSFDAALAIVNDLIALDRENSEWQLDLAEILRRIGDIERDLGRTEAALRSYQQGKVIIQRLADQDPSNWRWQKELASSFARVGDIHIKASNQKDSLEAYNAAWAIIIKRVEIDGNAKWRSRLVTVERKIGDVLLVGGDRQGAKARYERSLSIARSLVQKTPDSTRYQRDLVSVLDRNGHLRFDAGDHDVAISYYREAAQRARKLLALSKPSVRWQLDLIVTLKRLADLGIERAENLAVIVSSYERLDRRDLLSPEYSKVFAEALEHFSKTN